MIRSIKRSVFSVLLGLVSVARADQIYSHSFGGSSLDSLNGIAADVCPGTETWMSSDVIKANGSLSGGAATSAWLDFFPQSGTVYTFSANVTSKAVEGHVYWLGIGFLTNSARVDTSLASGLAHVGIQRDGNAITSVNGKTLGGTSDRRYWNSGSDMTVNLTLILDTTAEEWVVNYLVNDVQLSTYTFVGGNPGITGVGIGKGVWGSGKFNQVTLSRKSAAGFSVNLLSQSVNFGSLHMLAAQKDMFDGKGVIDRNQSASETPRVSNTTGFRWGGLIRSQVVHTNRVIDFYQKTLRFVSSLHAGSYVYTVFSKNGDGRATDGINLASAEAAIIWDISRKRATETSVRHLLRDGAGQWFISNSEQLDSSADAQRLETIVSSLLWHRLDSVHTARMNCLEEEVMAVREERNLSWSQILSSPDLSRVTGGGLYIENGWDNYQASDINVTQIASVEWQSGLPELGVESSLGAFEAGQGFGPDLPDTREIFLANTGRGILQISSLDIEDKSGRFLLDTNGPLSLKEGERFALHVTYDPDGNLGLHQTQLVVTHNAAGTEGSISSVALIGRPLVDRDFPGGNIIVDKVKGQDFFMRQEQRDTPGWWFYWCFRLRGAQDQTLNFSFNSGEPDSRVAIGARGPAFSRDGGVTWEWQGVHQRTFSFSFGSDDKEILFSSEIPYWESHLQRFLKKHEGNTYLRREVLTHSRKGREVERLHLGRLDGDAQFRVFLTSGHHACEMMAMYVLEGVMEKMLDASETGEWLRTHVELLAIPFVDKDGVEDGDQGKNRAPYDHVGGYRDDSIYPETSAITNFVPGWAEGKLELVIDLHCPALRGTFHEVIMTPVRLRGPEEEWLLVENFLTVLEKVQTGPLKFKLSDSQEFTSWGHNPEDEAKRAPYGSAQFPAWARRTFPGITAFPLETPYANVRWDRKNPAGDEVNQETARLFGRDLGQAIYVWLKAKADTPSP